MVISATGYHIVIGANKTSLSPLGDNCTKGSNYAAWTLTLVTTCQSQVVPMSVPSAGHAQQADTGPLPLGLLV